MRGKNRISRDSSMYMRRDCMGLLEARAYGRDRHAAMSRPVSVAIREITTEGGKGKVASIHGDGDCGLYRLCKVA